MDPTAIRHRQAGAILVCINPAYRTHELEYVLNQSGTRLLVAATSFKSSDYAAMIDQVRPGCPALQDDLTQRILDETGGQGLAVAFDFVGIPAVSGQAAGCLAADGKLVLVGVSHQPLGLDIYGVVVRQLQVLGHYASAPEHVRQLVNLAARGRLELSRSVSEVLPPTDAARAVDRLRRKEGNPIRLVLQP